MAVRKPGKMGSFRARVGRGALTAVLGLALTGCAGFWDDVTSHDFEVSSLFIKPNPLVVLKDSNDGDKRARALRTLREPKQNGLTDQDQDFVVTTLCTAAVAEHQYCCRLAAIQSLGHFKDPRAVQGLEDAYYKADAEYREGKFPLETVSAIQCQVLRSLGETGNPAAVAMLTRVVGEARVEGAEKEQQQAMDKRIAAARALGHFTGSQVTETLVKLLKTEKDVALRNSAHDSLVAITGKDLPPEYEQWNDLLHQTPPTPTGVAQEKSSWDKMLIWVGVGN